ncbi:hypothetical protein JW949_02120 [Candidatus Woesearchaeota archaeon]|nr:hypothetical protein [Candidatus Woesearchaeota archaeon]
MIKEKLKEIYLTSPYIEPLALGYSLMTLAGICSNDGFLAGLGAVSLAGCGFVIRDHFKAKNRLEKIIQKCGYDDRIFRLYSSTPCGVALGGVVAEKYGFLNKYKGLLSSI